MFLNKAILIGNLTKDPEIKALPSGVKVCTFGLATNRIWKDREGRKQEAADFHNIVVFDRQAETVAQYMKKGSSVMVEGRIQNRVWDAPDGQKRYRSEIVAEKVQFGPKSGGAPGSAPYAGKKTDTPAADISAEADAPAGGAIEYPEEEINPDDIPF